MRVQVRRRLTAVCASAVVPVLAWVGGLDMFQRHPLVAIGCAFMLLIGFAVYFFPDWRREQEKEDQMVDRVARRMNG